MRRFTWSAIQQTIPVRIVMKGLNDWLFNLAGLLAYNLLLAMFPLFLLLIGCLIAIAGAISTRIAPGMPPWSSHAKR